MNAFRILGLLHERTDTAEAIRWFERAIDAGDILSLRLIGNLHFRKQEQEAAGMWYRRAAEAGDKVSQSYYNYPGQDRRPVPDELAPPPDPEAESKNEEDWDDEEGFGPSPRTLRLLEATFEILGDMAYDILKEIRDLPVDLHENETFIFSDMPVITWRQSVEWRLQMVRCFDDLANDIKAGEWPQPTCTGEEMALHLAISHASCMVVDEPELVTSFVEGVPPHHNDWDWGLCITVLLEDTDVLFLYKPWAQGIEDSNHLTNQMLGIANLEAEDWFKPFYGDSDRDPNRGLRRLPAVPPGKPARTL
ncbi:sel1 repeat family protein [Streptomyces acidiscabies]|uniref:sel1 repeat family protein n=1 Tax=Streptomyces acidiscabies TaxID=42234 RepID=UPI000950FC86|nr:sel1 repeat family protein [Streptomyces acidiscabies]